MMNQVVSGGDQVQASEVCSLRGHTRYTYSSSNELKQHTWDVSVQGCQLEPQNPGFIALVQAASHNYWNSRPRRKARVHHISYCFHKKSWYSTVQCHRHWKQPYQLVAQGLFQRLSSQGQPGVTHTSKLSWSYKRGATSGPLH